MPGDQDTEPRISVQMIEKTKKRRKRIAKDSSLSADQKRENHVSSEQRRRLAMRESYDKLVEAVPDLQMSENRSELLIYAKTYKYVTWLYARNKALREELDQKRSSKGVQNLGKGQIPDYLQWDLQKN